MRAGTATAVARPIYYDRAPVPTVIAYNATVGPHGQTTRASYTVPTGKKAFIESLFAFVQRAAAATAAGNQFGIIGYTPASAAYADIAAPVVNSNTVGTSQALTLTNFGMMAAGDAIFLQTVDNSTGGTGWHLQSCKFNVFDA